MMTTRAARTIVAVFAAIGLNLVSVPSAEPAGDGSPVCEVNRPNLDGYQLLTLALAAGEVSKLPAPNVMGGAAPPAVLCIGRLNGQIIQFWSTGQNLANLNAKRPADAPPNVDHLGPVLVQLRERDVSKLAIAGDTIRGSIRFGLRPAGALRYWVVLELDAKVTGAAVTGTYTWTATEAGKDHADTGKVVVKHGAALTGSVTTAAEIARDNSVAPGQEYLSWRGDGSGCARPGKARLTEDAGRVRMRWISEDDVGAAWGATALYFGGYNPPLLANNRIYVAYLRPTVHPQATPVKLGRSFDCSPADAKKYSVKEADEVVVCLDAATGATLWKQAFIKDGENAAGVAKYGPWLPPCMDDGRLFMESAVGHVYCLDAATGKVLWRVPNSQPRTDKNCGTSAALQAGDGVVVTASAVGLDAKTGAKVWGPSPLLTAGARGNGTVTRLKWVHEGVTYFVTRDGCVRAKDGKECWKVPYVDPGPDPNDPNRKLRVARSPFPVLHGDRLVIPSRIAFDGKVHSVAPVPTTCYRMYPDRLEKLWEVPWTALPLGLDHAPVIYDGHVYFSTRSSGQAVSEEATSVAKEDFVTACVELATGKVKSLVPTAGEVNNFNHLLCQDGLAYAAAKSGRFLKLQPSGAKDLWAGLVGGKRVVARLPIYDGHVYPVFLDGRMFRRMCDGFVACYDFREKETEPKGPGV